MNLYTEQILKRRRRIIGVITAFFIIIQLLWIFLPVTFAVLWSLVDPDNPWSYPDAFPKVLSFAQWQYVFEYTNIIRALATSYSIAPLATLLAFVLSLPTAYAIGRKNFIGKQVVSNLILLPIILPGMVVALFLSRVFSLLGLSQSYIGLVIGHCLMGMPFMLKILITSFASIPQDVIDAAENLGANTWEKIRHVFIPMVLPGLFAGSIFTFITSLEEFNLTFVIGTPTFETVPTILFSFLGYHFIRTNAAVVSLILMVPNIIMLLLAERMMKTDYLSASLGKM